ncbi:bifunctional 4-hydroxy-2-oxoglutarate aldolase/2-dehydro-3-deoxy-phosphogluconate aldolase [Microbacterium sp. NPDC056234]|uniref:bifunctional 4-hydroxy-2-oxoglutarate aldolase/2-dehydro-3-deoxy-phosphogluconate aldolase n=1 Tax=Microbacterium sp. NPDC056234 TaxID=3345757 RepID=UPI0035DA3DEC
MAGTMSTARVLPFPAESRVVPVVVIDDHRAAAPLARALSSGGIATAEITLRTPHALDAITAVANVGGFLVGAGTVLTALDVDRAVDAGAAYVVSPGLAGDVVTRALERRIPVIPGVATATEVQHAVALGLRQLKLFPAENVGGADLVNALGGPFPEVSFLPSGGVTASNANEYLQLSNVFAVSGSWMVPRELLRERDFTAIERLSAATTQALLR